MTTRRVVGRPSRGDDGIDVLAPVSDDPTRFDIHQIKYFHQALTSSQRSQIGNSVGALLKAVREDRISVRDWHLVMPIDPTERDEAWLDKLFEGTGITPYWKGESHLDGWAAKYPDVVDYYINGGRERTSGQLDRVLTLAEFKVASGSGRAISVESAVDTLSALYATLNHDEPHYRFEFSVISEAAASLDHCPPGATMQSCVELADDRVACFDIYPRYDEAAIDCPIAVELEVRIPHSRQDLVQVVERFRQFGDAVSIPSGFVESLSNDPLHGLQYSDSLMFRLEPLPPLQPVRLRLLVRNSDSETIQALPVTVRRFTTGELGGMVAEMISDSGVLVLRQQVAPDGQPSRQTEFDLDLSWPDQIAAHVINDIRFADAIAEGMVFAMAPEHFGPVTELAKFGEDASLGPDWLLLYCEALAMLQDFAEEPLRLAVPDDGSATFINEAFGAARFLQGAEKVVKLGHILVSLEMEPEAACETINREHVFLFKQAYSGHVAGVQVTFPDAIFMSTEVHAQTTIVAGETFVVVSSLTSEQLELHIKREKFIQWED